MRTKKADGAPEIVVGDKRSSEYKIRERLSALLVEINFTETEKKILVLLADGQQHLVYDVIRTVGDEMMTAPNLTCHMRNIRRKLRPIHHTIVCVRHTRRSFYQYVILLSSLL